MAIEKVATPDEPTEGSGRWLYEVLSARLQRLPTAAQLSLGLAIQRRVSWGQLSDQAREAFEAAAEDMQL
jgi:hypothetical protein